MVEKILFISIFKEGYGGGEGRVAYEMARWFSKHYDVVMLCPGERTGLVEDESGFKEFHVRSSGEKNLYLSLLNAIEVKRIYDFLEKFKPDVIHMHDPALLNVIGQLWAKYSRVPVFYTAHILPDRALDFGATEISRLLDTPINDQLVRRYLLNFYQQCDAVIGLNQITATKIRNFGYRGRIFQIPNGRDLNMYHRNGHADITEDEKRLTFVGALGKRKNQEFLIEAMQYLPENYHLQLVGLALDVSNEKHFREQAETLGVKVSFMGQLSQQEVAGVLAKTHVFVSASKMEVQSLAIIEALASGTPVVGLGNETVDELVDDSNGVCLPHDSSAKDFAAAIRSVCESSPVVYEELCQNAYQRVSMLDWSLVMEKTVQCYETVLALQLGQTSISRIKVYRQFIANIPGRRLRSEIARLAAYLPGLPRSRRALPVKALSIALLNMSVSAFGYYLLKIGLGLKRLFKKK
ncbi:MAG: glycosyltransferase family 4 protein [Anaerolineaceae bacterium]|jgi:glycosyltransferase involved in cell wall biosynthesis|nr:glycosyltransferase family 4 protein [Anaerolineaceae bacterium]